MPFELPWWGMGLVFFLTIVGMEGGAYAAHRWLMHGPLWCLHRSHHRRRRGIFEKNDGFAVAGALPSIALIWLGVDGGGGNFCTTVGAGMAGYGVLYFALHDVLVHQRLPLWRKTRSPLLRHIRAAHGLHHVVRTKKGAVSFGFLYAPPLARLRAALGEKRLIEGPPRER